jgi:hypothetical protein
MSNAPGSPWPLTAPSRPKPNGQRDRTGLDQTSPRKECPRSWSDSSLEVKGVSEVLERFEFRSQGSVRGLGASPGSKVPQCRGREAIERAEGVVEVVQIEVVDRLGEGMDVIPPSAKATMVIMGTSFV